MMKRIACIICSVLLLCSLTLSLAGCGAQSTPEPQPEPPSGGTTVKLSGDLMQGVTAGTPAGVEDLAADGAQLADFALRLFKAGQEEGKNTLLSPLSVLCALAMTANGAVGETRDQMETVLGMKVGELNEYLYTYMRDLPADESCRLSLANSIWFTDDDSFAVNTDFLQTNADYYGAGLYKEPFNDETCRAINNWVKEKTEGMIPEILDRIPQDAVMYLVNALAFKAEWMEPYTEENVRKADFTRADGKKQEADFLYGRENTYLETPNAAGFMKYYAGGDYAFAALLPNEGVSVEEVVNSLTGEQLHSLLTEPMGGVVVNTAIPKFETKYSTELSQVLCGMGMPIAFDGNRADFTALGIADWNIFISRVLHKTFISVTEKGTEAGAATVVEMMKNTAFMPPQEIKTVYLDRPFVYMLVDLRTGSPFFIGAMTDLTA